MKLTKSQLARLIKEEISNILNEQTTPPWNPTPGPGDEPQQTPGGACDDSLMGLIKRVKQLEDASGTQCAHEDPPPKWTA